jgi:hypothetical protein
MGCLAAKRGCRTYFESMNERGVQMRRGLLLSLVGAAVGCVGGNQLAPPSKGGPPWLELRSERFRVLTDLGRRDAEYVIAELDRVYGLLAKATGYGPDKEVLDTRVFVFRTYDELQKFIPSRSGGMYTDSLESDDGTSVHTLLIHGTFERYGRTMFAHELAHRFMRSAIGRAHPWLHEGLAQYYSTVHGTPEAPVVGDRDGENVAAAGKPWSAPGYVVYMGEELLVSSLLAASKVTAFEASDFYGEEENGRLSWEANERTKRNYFVAWALVHMLLHEQYDYALEVQSALATAPATGGKGGAAIERIVDGVSPVTLNQHLVQYLGKPGRVRQRTEPVAKVPADLDARDIPEQEVLEYWALLAPLRTVRQAPRGVGKGL